MNPRRFAVTAALVGCLSVLSCDPYVFARARAPLVAPVDSACMMDALARRLGPPKLPPHLEKRTRWTPAELSLHYGPALFAQTYADTGAATLSATQTVATGLRAVFGPPRRAQDSVSRQLGRDLLAVRDACGGRTPPGPAELEYER